MNTFSISEALAFGWETFKKNVSFLIVLVIIMAAANFGVGIVLGLLGDSAPAVILSNVLTYVVTILVSIGATKIFIDLVDGKNPSYNDLYRQYPLIVNYFIAEVIMGLAILAGLILLIIPGIYLAVKLSFASYLVVDKKLGPIDALKQSYEITKGNWWNIVFLGVVSGLITLAGALALLVGLFVAIPVTMLAYAYAYRKLSGSIAAAAAPVAAAPITPAPVAAVPEPTQTPEPAPATPTPESTPTTI